MSVLVVVSESVEVPALLGWGAQICRALDEDLVVLRPLPGKRTQGRSVVAVEGTDAATDEVTTTIIEFLAANGFLGLVPKATQSSEPRDTEDPSRSVEVVTRTDPNRMRCTLREIHELDPSLLVVSKRGKKQSSDLAHGLLTNAPCATLVLRAPAKCAAQAKSVLVPTAGGRHVRGALQLANRLAALVEGQVTAMYVESAGGEHAEDVGMRQVTKHVEAAGLDVADVNPVVILADSVPKGIVRATESQAYDLIVVGASEKGAVRRTLFGTLPASLLAMSHSATIGVYRDALPVTVRTTRFIGRWLARRVPQMDREQRIALFDRMQSGSSWNVDFVTLISLSSSIAALGLILNSTAVVIGAMLVAPLMTPMLGAGLGLVQGNVRLVKNALRTIFFGFTSALVLSLLVGMLVPEVVLTPELAGRGAPNLLDLAVALLSGIAAAYASSRKGLSSALPGVAIAAALVPPIATTGISITLGELATARGAATLFVTNFVAIVLGAAVTLYLVGARPDKSFSFSRVWVRRTLLALVVGCVLLALPLGLGFFSRFSAVNPLRTALKERVEQEPATRFHSMSRARDERGDIVEIVITAPTVADATLATDLAAVARKVEGDRRVVRVITRIATESPP